MARPPMQSVIEHHSELFAMVWCCMGKEVSAAEVVWQLSMTANNELNILTVFTKITLFLVLH